MRHGQIEILNLPLKPKYLILPGQFLILGRGHNADIVLQKDSAVSRLHCKVFAEQGDFYVGDSGSRNHTLINDAPIQKHQKQPLRHGDIIQVGHFKIRFTILEEKISEAETLRQEDFLLFKRSDKLTGKIAVKLGFITKEKLKACGEKQEQMAHEGPYYPFEDILLQEKHLTREQLDKVEEYKHHFPYNIPNYKLTELIGMGGMGHIYRAQARKDNQCVAIKVLGGAPKDMEELLREQFRREATAMLEMNHLNIVKGIEFAETKECSFLVMEYVDGPTLQQKLKEHYGRLLSDQTLDIVMQVTKALEHAQEHGLIHRDIKPENILLSRDNVVKLCDFGLVKNTNIIDTKEEKTFGTIAYMSPEQIRGDPNLDIRSDIYSLGTVFYRILFGQLPFIGDIQQIRQQHLNRPLVFPDEGKHLQKMELSRVIKKMMAKTPDARYQSPSLLLQELENLKQRFLQNDSGTNEEVMATDELPRLSVKSFALTSVHLSSLTRLNKLRRHVGKIVTCLVALTVGLLLFLGLSPNRGEKAYQTFTWALQTGDQGEAEKEAQQFLENFPQHARAARVRLELQRLIYRKAKAAYEQSKLLETIVFCQDILHLDGDSPAAAEANRLVQSAQEQQNRRRRQEILEKTMAQIDQLLSARSLAKVPQELTKLKSDLREEEMPAWQVRFNKWQQLSLQERVAAYRYYPAAQLNLDNAASPGKAVRPLLLFPDKPALRSPIPGVAAPFLLWADGHVHCLEADSGKIRWSQQMDSGRGGQWLFLAGLEAVQDNGKADRVLLSAQDSSWLKMVSLASGNVIWEKRLPAAVCSAPLWQLQELWLACSDNATYRLAGLSGEIAGAVRTPAPVRYLAAGQLTLVRNVNKERSNYAVLYLGCDDGYIYGVHAKEGILQLYLPYRGKLAALLALPYLLTITVENDAVSLSSCPEFAATSEEITFAAGRQEAGAFYDKEVAAQLHWNMPMHESVLVVPGKDRVACFSGQRAGFLSLSGMQAGDTQERLAAWQVYDTGMHVSFACWSEKELEIVVTGDKLRIYALPVPAKSWQPLWEQSGNKPVLYGMSFLPWQRSGDFYFLNTHAADNTWGQLWRLEAGKRELLWQKRPGGQFSLFSPPLQDRYVWFALRGGAIGQMDLKAQPLPSYRILSGHPGEDVTSNFVLPPQQNKLLVLRDKGTLKTFDAVNGKPGNDWQWSEKLSNLGTGVAVTPYLNKLQDYVVFFTQSNRLKAVCFGSGRKLDEFTTSEAEEFTTPPVYFNYALVVGNRRGNLYRLQLSAKGPLLRKTWFFAGDGAWCGTPIVTKSEVYATSDKGSVYCLKAEQGSKTWHYAGNSAITDKLLLGEKTLCLGNDGGLLWALDCRTGKLLWQVNLGAGVCGKIIADRDRIYAATTTGRLVAVHAQRGQIVWEQRLATRLGMLCLLWQNCLYVGDTAGFLHIVKVTG
jgi:serine/threonine protein kinase/outer membrane protein assembly factor BamB